MTCVRLATWGLVLLTSCSAVEGPLLHARDAGGREPAGDGGSDAADVPRLIEQDVAWQYQLVGDVDPAIDAELFVIDLFDVEPALLVDLHARGKVVVAYLSAGTFEPFRQDAAEFPDAALGNALSAYPDEAWLDVRDPTVRALMAARLTLARDKGFDGVLLTNLTAYLSDSGFALGASEQDAYTTWLAAETQGRKLRAGMSGDFERSAELAPHFDFAIHFGCIARADCAELAPLASLGKPVFDVETEGDAAEVCALAAEQGVNVLLKPSGFGAYREGCP